MRRRPGSRPTSWTNGRSGGGAQSGSPISSPDVASSSTARAVPHRPGVLIDCTGAVRNTLEAGVRSIEHGNLIDAAVAQEIKQAGAYLVPTMVTYEAVWREGKGYGVSDHQPQKINSHD